MEHMLLLWAQLYVMVALAHSPSSNVFNKPRFAQTGFHHRDIPVSGSIDSSDILIPCTTHVPYRTPTNKIDNLPRDVTCQSDAPFAIITMLQI